MIIFSDIDGTLLNDEHRVTPKTLRAIRQVQEKGIPFVIVSARSPSGIYPILNENKLQCPIICYSGGLILDENRKVLSSKGMTKNIARHVIDYIEEQKFDCSWNIYSYDRWVVKNCEDPRVKLEESIVHAFSERGNIDSLQKEDVVHKILCMCNPEKIIDIEEKLRRTFPVMSIVKSSGYLLEIMAQGVNKGDAALTLCDILELPYHDLVAFGDNYNDEALLEVATTPYLMGNAPEDLKKRFPNVTRDNNHEGIYHALLHEGMI